MTDSKTESNSSGPPPAAAIAFVYLVMGCVLSFHHGARTRNLARESPQGTRTVGHRVDYLLDLLRASGLYGSGTQQTGNCCTSSQAAAV